MKAFRRQSLLEKGQSIVIFTVSLAVLLMLMSLVLDGGLLLLRRREAQASADSGSLAGASYLCGETPDYTTATTEATNYAITLNQATGVDISFPGTNSIQVEATISQTPALAGLMGFGDIDVQALARAECQEAGSASNLMPFVFLCTPPLEDDESDSEDCVQKIYDEEAEAEGPAEYDYYTIVHNSEPSDDDYWCIYPPNTIPEDEDSGWESGVIDCDFDDDGIDDLMDSASRGWVSLDGSTGAGTFFTWIEEGFEGEVPIHTWLSSKTGVANSVISTIEDTQVGNIVLIPVYDDFCEGNNIDPEDDCPGGWHADSAPPDNTIFSPPNKKFYHIMGFAGFKITCVFSGGSDDCDYRNYLLDNFDEYDDLLTQGGSFKSIEGYFVSIVSSDFGAGGGADAGGYVVRLTQ